MGPDEQGGFRSDPDLRPVIWRVMRAGGQSGGKSEMPAEVSHAVPRGGWEMGLAGALAAQRGLVTRPQLVALGFSPKAIEHRVGTGWLHRVHRSVFSVGSPVLQPWGAEMAALLSVGGDAVISHASAAAVWGLIPNPSFVAITMIGRRVTEQQ